MLRAMNEASPLIAAQEDLALAPQDRSPRRAGRIGVLLANLGTPDAPNAASVRRYLREFLSDRRVIENQGPLWKLILNCIILPVRPRRKALDYARIWNQEKNESPLKTITRSQAQKLASALAPLEADIMVDWGMRYGNPSLASRIAHLAKEGCERLLLIPLYPQYCAATTATVCDEAFRALALLRHQPALRIAAPYYNDPVYIAALAEAMQAGIARLEFKPQLILASFHGVPKAFVEAGDPYYDHCMETTRLLRERLDIDPATLMLTFQSRFGRDEWLEPATIETVAALAQRGIKGIAVITPGFAADCLETLEEIAVENARVFRMHGGESFAALPCLNESEQGMNVIRQLSLRELAGWARDPACGRPAL
jgi:protoporphyrin/coproporphyrin ferrochelatase